MNELDRSADELARLEDAAVAGEIVTPAELSAARERVNLATLAARGDADRKELQRQATVTEAREAAKLSAAKIFEGHDRDIAEAFEAAKVSLELLVEAVEAGHARIAEGALILRHGAVASRGWDGTSPDDLDPANHASMEQGGTVSVITLQGKGHSRESAALWVAAAVHAVARAHGGLQLPGGMGPLEPRLRFEKPRGLAEARIATHGN